ncbi:MAG: peptide ABC transporter substrate-binding protein, partial [Gemmatimonadales bacterium]
LALGVAACEPRGGCSGEYCGTLVINSPGQVDILLPPVSEQVAARAISDQIFLKLADVGMLTNTVGDAEFEPLLAERWEWPDSLTLVFHLDPRARWHDGARVTAADVAFTFDAYTDPRVNSPYRAVLRSIRTVTVRDSGTVVFRFGRRSPEMFYDAVYHLRILPAHLLRETPREQWVTAPFGRAPVGSGPYRFVSWQAGQHIELAADSTFFLGRPHLRRLIWRSVPDLQVAVTRLVAGEADVQEVLLTPANVEQVRRAPHLATYSYKGSLHTYLALNLAARGDSAQPHPLFGDREVRRALWMATDRERLLRSVFGDLAKVPPGPVSQLWWIWDREIRQLPYDTTEAARVLERRGWRDNDGDGVRDRGGTRFAFGLLVPTTSAVRKQYARLLQEAYRGLGLAVEIEELEPSVLEQRARGGLFDAALLTRSTDPTPTSGFAQTWTRAGLGGSNLTRYESPAFERLLAAAGEAANPAQARAAWRAALEVLNQDVPGIWLNAPDNVAAVHARVADVRIRSDAWWALLRTWRIPADQLIDRDRVER